jgi:hypothetical protein
MRWFVFIQDNSSAFHLRFMLMCYAHTVPRHEAALKLDLLPWPGVDGLSKTYGERDQRMHLETKLCLIG